MPGHGSSTRKATGFGSLDTNATTQEGPINNLSSLNRQTRLDLQRKQKSGDKNLLCLQEYQTSGTRHCLTLPHRSVMLRKYFNVPCNALKNKKSPHRIAVKPRDCWVLISLAIKVLKSTSDVLGSDLSQDCLACFPRRDVLHTGVTACNTYCTATGAQAPSGWY